MKNTSRFFSIIFNSSQKCDCVINIKKSAQARYELTHHYATMSAADGKSHDSPVGFRLAVENMLDLLSMSYDQVWSLSQFYFVGFLQKRIMTTVSRDLSPYRKTT